MSELLPSAKLFITLNTVDRHPLELFAQIGKAGSDVSAFTEAIARLISISSDQVLTLRRLQINSPESAVKKYWVWT